MYPFRSKNSGPRPGAPKIDETKFSFCPDIPISNINLCYVLELVHSTYFIVLLLIAFWKPLVGVNQSYFEAYRLRGPWGRISGFHGDASRRGGWKHPRVCAGVQRSGFDINQLLEMFFFINIFFYINILNMKICLPFK